MKFKSILLSQEPKTYYIEQTDPLRTAENIFKIPSLDHSRSGKDSFANVSTCLFLPGNKEEKA